MFRFSTADVEGTMNVSKWLNIQALLDTSEIKELFEILHPCLIVPVGCVVERAKPHLATDEFFKSYDLYVDALKRGLDPQPRHFASAFSCALSRGPEEFYAIEVGADKMLVKPLRPVVQMQAHSMGYSVIDEQIYPMVRGPDTITWGIQFGFPALFQDRKKTQANNTFKDEGFRNSELFQLIQKWMRRHTRSTPLMIHQRVANIPVRIGHQCFSWVNNHPTLRFHGLVVENEGDEG